MTNKVCRMEKKTTDQEPSPDNSEEDSTSLLPEGATLVEELENISNGGSTLLDLENNEVFESSDSEGNHLELSYSQSENDLSTVIHQTLSLTVKVKVMKVLLTMSVKVRKRN